MAENITSGGMSFIPGGMSRVPTAQHQTFGKRLFEAVKGAAPHTVMGGRIITGTVPISGPASAVGSARNLGSYFTKVKNFILPPVTSFKQFGMKAAIGATTVFGLLEARKLGKVAGGGPLSGAIPTTNQLVGSLGGGLSLPGTVFGYAEQKGFNLADYAKKYGKKTVTDFSPVSNVPNFGDEAAKIKDYFGTMQAPQFGMPTSIALPSAGSFAPSLSVGGGGGGMGLDLAAIALLLGAGGGYLLGHRKKKKKRKYKKKRKRR